MDPEEAIRSYYACFRERDKEGLRALLTSDFRHVSAFGEHTDREVMIDAIWPGVGSSWAEDLRIVGAHPEFVAHFTTVSTERPPVRVAERIVFRGDRLAGIEVFFGRQLDEPPRAGGAPVDG